MILIVSSFPSAQNCAKAITKACGQRTSLVANQRDFAAALREGEYSLILMDQAFADMNPKSVDQLWKSASGAAPVFVNLALTSVERVAADCKAALQRRERDRQNALRHASAALRNEITGSVTGILLSSELALAEPELPRNLKAKLESVHSLALDIKHRLDPTA